MPRRIALLPDAVADQIAAGEVVERPASVVKELAENAIDAEARFIRVSIEGGGKTLIEVSDDGHGMGREDAILAMDRHATSKLRSAADLVGVRTFGFRGEALPAIASISRFGLTTAEENGTGTEITVTGGRLEGVHETARQRGTTVRVRGIFFNTPARRKFLRSQPSETRATTEVVATLALAHPSVGFEFHADEQLRMQVPAGQTSSERLTAVWGRDLAGTLLPASHAVGGTRVEGFIQRPGDATPTGRRTQLFVNGRPFRDPFLIRAAEAGYRSAIHPGDRPSIFLNILVDAGAVDVNVHPAKLEVRFRDRMEVERAVEETVRQALGPLAAAAPIGEWRPMPGAPPVWQGSAQGGAAPISLEQAADLFAPEAESPALSADAHSFQSIPLPTPYQLFDTYLVYENDGSLIFVDQHSAHERVIYEATMARLTGHDAPAQRLLLPITLELTDEELDAVESHTQVLQRVGFEAEAFGGRTVVIHAVPTPHPRFDAVRCFKELVADLARGRFGGWASPLERFAATFACRAAIKGGERLDASEMRELLARLMAAELPAHDVHGRATIVQLPREELERRFGRR
ncbi:MAG: DNA mismatch repair endonuclease MutL [Gemmatimonadota bacterium]